MLDLLLLRQQTGVETLYDSQKKRFKSTELVDKCIQTDQKWKDSTKYNFMISNL
jgi:hypothetical protein